MFIVVYDASVVKICEGSQERDNDNAVRMQDLREESDRN